MSDNNNNNNTTRGPKGAAKSTPAAAPRPKDNGVGELAAGLVKGFPEELIELTEETVDIFEQLEPLFIVIDESVCSGSLLVQAPEELSDWFTYCAPELIRETLGRQIRECLTRFPLPGHHHEEPVDITSEEVAKHLYHSGVEHVPAPYALDLQEPLGPHLQGKYNTDPRSQVPYPDMNYASHVLVNGPAQFHHGHYASAPFTEGFVLTRYQKAFHQVSRYKRGDWPNHEPHERAAKRLWDEMTRLMRDEVGRPTSYDHLVDPAVERSEEEWQEDERFSANTQNVLPGVKVQPFQLRHFSVCIRFLHAETGTQHTYVLPTFRSMARKNLKGDYLEYDVLCESFRRSPRES